ncbi:hypothetical protein RGF97_16855 [Streptomyces roseicoloratus]|uniref:Uncharacterized protein n=1 Tax=Streptomyces roseicoloratus TaxID=2508722 RepID=A0ABY9RWM8_9ACTN|nr:hypothetical protein [Streptomyces roseicoloratus]WMX46174.1 hypothetical protein RGF97_16855 [Streptomyces roseicoloratus]
MAEQARETWLNHIAATGLTVSDDIAPDSVPPVLETVRSVANWEVKPSATVPLKHPNALQEVDRQWHLHAEDCGLFGQDGSFLLTISGSGTSAFGWASVKWSAGAELAPRLAKPEEGLDFVAMSVDGNVVCAVTEEEYDYWIVVQNLR